MKLDVHVRLNTLSCIASDDPSGEDEPYLWTILLTLDGSSLRQRSDNPYRFAPSVTTQAGPGRPGNLGGSITSGGHRPVPPAVGDFHTPLRPISLTFPTAAGSVQLFVPGEVALLAILLDEDATRRDHMESAFNDTKTYLRNRLNDLLAGIDLQPIAQAALSTPDPATALRNQLTQRFTGIINALRGDVQQAAIQAAQIAVLSDWELWDPFTSAVEALDHDDFIGAGTYRFNERTLFAGNLVAPFESDLPQPKVGLGGAWYHLTGFTQGTAQFGPPDLTKTLSSVPRPQPVTEEYTFHSSHLVACIAEGLTVTATRLANDQAYQLSVGYPFVTFEYAINGTPVPTTPPQGTITLPGTDVTIPEFDETIIGPDQAFVRQRATTADVTLQYRWLRRAAQPQIPVLELRNDPAQGNFGFAVAVAAVLPNGSRLPVATTGLGFEGQSLRFPESFVKWVKQCLENFFGNRWSISKRLTLVDLWSPHGRTELLDRITRELDALAEIGQYTPETVATVRSMLARRLGVTPVVEQFAPPE